MIIIPTHISVTISRMQKQKQETIYKFYCDYLFCDNNCNRTYKSSPVNSNCINNFIFL